MNSMDLFNFMPSCEIGVMRFVVQLLVNVLDVGEGALAVIKNTSQRFWHILWYRIDVLCYFVLVL